MNEEEEDLNDSDYTYNINGSKRVRKRAKKQLRKGKDLVKREEGSGDGEGDRKLETGSKGDKGSTGFRKLSY